MGTANAAMIVAVFIPHWITGPLVTCLALAALIEDRTFEGAKGEWDVPSRPSSMQ